MKVNNGWQSKSIDEVESLISRKCPQLRRDLCTLPPVEEKALTPPPSIRAIANYTTAQKVTEGEEIATAPTDIQVHEDPQSL